MSLQEILGQYLPDCPDTVVRALEGYINEHLGESGTIPKSRFDEVIGQRNGLREQLQSITRELGALREHLGQESDTGQLREENERLTQQVARFRESEWRQYLPFFEADSQHPLYERIQRIRGDFNFPDDGEEWTLEMIAHNLDALQPYLKADYFRLPEIPAVDSTKPVAVGEHPAPSIGNLFKAFGE